MKTYIRFLMGHSRTSNSHANTHGNVYVLTALTLGKRFKQTCRVQRDRKTSGRWRRLWIFDSRCDGPENAASFCQLVLIYGAFRGPSIWPGLFFKLIWGLFTERDIMTVMRVGLLDCLNLQNHNLLMSTGLDAFGRYWKYIEVRSGFSSKRTKPTAACKYKWKYSQILNWESLKQTVQTKQDVHTDFTGIQQLVKNKFFILLSDSREAGIYPRLLLHNAGIERKDFRGRGV